MTILLCLINQFESEHPLLSCKISLEHLLAVSLQSLQNYLSSGLSPFLKDAILSRSPGETWSYPVPLSWVESLNRRLLIGPNVLLELVSKEHWLPIPMETVFSVPFEWQPDAVTRRPKVPSSQVKRILTGTSGKGENLKAYKKEIIQILKTIPRIAVGALLLELDIVLTSFRWLFQTFGEDLGFATLGLQRFANTSFSNVKQITPFFVIPPTKIKRTTRKKRMPFVHRA